MKPERWQQIERLYYAALERDATERAAFLAEACAGDEELRLEVESLLAVHEQSESFLARPALEVAAQVVAEDQGQPMSGRMINHYRVLTLLGAGGMGEVCLPEDTRLRRKGAVKPLPPKYPQDLDPAQRFHTEGP